MSLPKVVFVTGGNNGLGYETVKAFYESDTPYHVLMGSRSLEKANAAVESLRKECPNARNALEIVQVDLVSDESINKAYEQVKASPGRLDCLINNAGLSLDTQFTAGEVTLREAFNGTYDVNVAGTHVLTWTFVPLLLASADPRLLFVAGLSQVTLQAVNYHPAMPPQAAGWPKRIDFETIAYKCSKTALNMLMLDYDHKLRGDGVKVWAVGPGMLLTDLGGIRDKLDDFGIRELVNHPSVGAHVLKGVVEGERDADVGKIVGKDGSFIPW